MDCYKTTPTSYLECVSRRIPVFSEGGAYIENYLQISSDHIKGATDTDSNPFIPEGFTVESENISISIIKQHLKTGGNILDVGCGTGRLLKQLNGVNRFGLDISSEYLKRLETEEITLCLSRIEDMPFKNDYFDMVVCTDVLEHVEDLNECLRNIVRVLKPEGTLLLRVPYREDLSIYLRDNYPYYYSHLRNFDENSLRLILKKVFKLRPLEIYFGPFICAPIYFKIPLLFKGGSFLARCCEKILRALPCRFSDNAKRWALNPVGMHLLVQK